MNLASNAIKDILVSNGFILGTDLFVGREPTTPVTCSTIFDTGIGAPDLTLDKGEYDRTSVQIRVRTATYTDGDTLINTITSLLQGFSNTSVQGVFYALIKVASGPAFLDWDDNNRPRFIVNFDIQRRPATACPGTTHEIIDATTYICVNDIII